MTAPGLVLGGVTALLLGFAGLERSLRHPGVARFVRNLDRGAHVGLSGSVAIGLLLLCWATPWSLLETDRRWVYASAAVGLLLAWNATTRDLDPVVSGPSRGCRLLLATFALLALWSPLAVGLTAVLLSAGFGFWQHHAAFPMRMHLLLVAYLCCSALGSVLGSLGVGQALARPLDEALVVVLSTMMVSHYLITALAKMALGPRPWSWMLDNRLHYLGASAYSWGWARFVPWPRFRRGLAALRSIEVPLQVVVFLLELSCPLALLDHRVGTAFAMAFAGFHVGVWLLSGLCFWDWLLTDLVIGGLLLTAPPGLGLPALVISVALLVLFPLRHKLWKPMPLGWYDSPLSQRVHWFVLGASGQEYRLDNGFMCPHERLYGKVHGCFAVDAGLVTYHLGECFRPEVRAAIVAAGPNQAALDAVRDRFGIRTRSERLTAAHVRYLQAFFALLNGGAMKSVLPSWARFLKAPGDQMYYWGEGPAYRKQEPVVRVRLVFREEYFDGRDLIRLRDEQVLAFDVPHESELEEPLPREMTPREMDDYLLGLAAGRLIRISGARGRYLSAEDEIRTV